MKGIATHGPKVEYCDQIVDYAIKNHKGTEIEYKMETTLLVVGGAEV